MSAVHFLGHRDDVHQILVSLDVFVVPSRSDGSPLVIHEAQQAGTPVARQQRGRDTRPLGRRESRSAGTAGFG